MIPFAEHFNKSFRLALLRLLEEAPAYQANAPVLQKAAGSMGFSVSRDQVMTQLDWLAEQGLIRIEEIGPVRVAHLTDRGHDVAKGYITSTGVERPSPRSSV